MCYLFLGNYVATLEGKQTFQKSDMLTVRIYTNWETNFIMNDPKKPTKYEKRHIRARIAGVVTPSSAKTEEDYLDMIEIPILFTSPTLLTCCQVRIVYFVQELYFLAVQIIKFINLCFLIILNL